MEKEVLVQFDSEAFKEFTELQEAVEQGKLGPSDPTYRQLLASINNAIKNLKANPFYGDLIPRKYLSKGVIARYGTDKILRIELIGYWRLLYTVLGNEARIIALILEYMSHDKYNKIFGYKKR